MTLKLQICLRFLSEHMLREEREREEEGKIEEMGVRREERGESNRNSEEYRE